MQCSAVQCSAVVTIFDVCFPFAIFADKGDVTGGTKGGLGGFYTDRREHFETTTLHCSTELN